MTASPTRIERIFARRKATLAICVLLSAAVGGGAITYRGAVYEARSSLEFEGGGSAPGWAADSVDIVTEIQVIRSFPVLFAVARSIGLVPEGVREEEAARNSTYQEIVQRVKDMVRPARRNETNIVDIHVETRDPKLARDVANGMAVEYQKFRTERTFEKGRWAEVASGRYKLSLEQSLEEAEALLSDFKLTHRMVEGHSALQVHLNRILDLDEGAVKIEQQRKRTIEILETLSRNRSADARSIPSLEISEAPIGYDAIRNGYLQALMKRQDLLISLTESHPDVMDLDGQIHDFKGHLSRFLEQYLQEMDVKLQYVAGQKHTLERSNEEFLADEVQFARLKRKVEKLQNALDRIDQTWQSAQVEGSFRTHFVRVLELAMLPREPLRKASMAPLAAFLLLGLAMGLGVAFLQESFHFTLHTVHDVESHLRMPVLAVIPRATPGRLKLQDPDVPMTPHCVRLVTHYFPRSPESESFRILRAAIGKKNPSASIILVTSSSAREGKSFVAANLAVAFAQAHRETLLVEANLRAPALHGVFPYEPDTGLTSILANNVDWPHACKDVYDFLANGLNPATLLRYPGLDALKILPAGPDILHPSEELEEVIRRGLFTRLRREFEVILIDSAPLLAFADAAILAPHVDVILLVYQVGRTSRAAAQRALDHLKSLQANVAGVVLNDVEMSDYPRTSHVSPDPRTAAKSPAPFLAVTS